MWVPTNQSGDALAVCPGTGQFLTPCLGSQGNQPYTDLFERPVPGQEPLWRQVGRQRVRRDRAHDPGMRAGPRAKEKKKARSPQRKSSGVSEKKEVGAQRTETLAQVVK